jgi:hypothetical protein
MRWLAQFVCSLGAEKQYSTRSMDVRSTVIDGVWVVTTIVFVVVVFIRAVGVEETDAPIRNPTNNPGVNMIKNAATVRLRLKFAHPSLRAIELREDVEEHGVAGFQATPTFGTQVTRH